LKALFLASLLCRVTATIVSLGKIVNKIGKKEYCSKDELVGSIDVLEADQSVKNPKPNKFTNTYSTNSNPIQN